jgi:extradiol dioxygenase family protein
LSWRRFSWLCGLTWLKLPIFRQFLVQHMKTNSKTTWVSLVTNMPLFIVVRNWLWWTNIFQLEVRFNLYIVRPVVAFNLKVSDKLRKQVSVFTYNPSRKKISFRLEFVNVSLMSRSDVICFLRGYGHWTTIYRLLKRSLPWGLVEQVTVNKN